MVAMVMMDCIQLITELATLCPHFALEKISWELLTLDTAVQKS